MRLSRAARKCLLPHAKEHLSIGGGLRADFHIHDCRADCWWRGGRWSFGRNGQRRNRNGRRKRRRANWRRCNNDNRARNNAFKSGGGAGICGPRAKRQHNTRSKCLGSSAHCGNAGTTGRGGASNFGHNNFIAEHSRNFSVVSSGSGYGRRHYDADGGRDNYNGDAFDGDV
jgi:hypothetical protein